MAWTAKTLFIKFLKGRQPPPALVAYLRVDYNQHTGIPIGMSVVEVSHLKGQGQCPPTEPHELDARHPSPTGLCSWHIFGAPSIVPERPFLIAETSPHLQLDRDTYDWQSQPNSQPNHLEAEAEAESRPISILTGEPEEPDESGYVELCPSGCEEGSHFPGCSHAT